MRYRIEYAGKRHCEFVNSRSELLKKLQSYTAEVTDIRKVYKSGVTDSVLETYQPYLDRLGRS